MAQTNTPGVNILCGWPILLAVPLYSVPALSCVSLLTLGMGWTLTHDHQARSGGHGWNPCAAHHLLWQPFLIPQQLELFFQGNEQIRCWLSSRDYIMYLRTSIWQRKHKTRNASSPGLSYLAARQLLYWSVLRLVVANILDRASTKTSLSWTRFMLFSDTGQMMSLVGQLGMSFLQGHCFRRLDNCNISGLWFSVQQLHFICSLA